MTIEKTHFADDETLRRIAELEAGHAKMRVALEWYQKEAQACNRHHGSNVPGSAHAILESIVALALDNGQRATAALPALAAKGDWSISTEHNSVTREGLSAAIDAARGEW